MVELLVSVRSVEEAQAALEGGASIIDVKEPSAGSLGRASFKTITGVVRQVARRVPVSAALGELGESGEGSDGLAFLRLDYAKWGLAGSRASWRETLVSAARELRILN